MNWLALSPRVLVFAIVGALLGSLLYAWSLSHGLDVPLVVGLATGLGSVGAAKDRSVLRGITIAVLALWASAITQSLAGPYAGTPVMHLSRTLTATRALGFVGSMLLAGALGAISLRKGAEDRLPGT